VYPAFARRAYGAYSASPYTRPKEDSVEGSTLRDDEIQSEVREGSTWQKDEVDDMDSTDSGGDDSDMTDTDADESDPDADTTDPS
jgi:hypothetical protein